MSEERRNPSGKLLDEQLEAETSEYEVTDPTLTGALPGGG
jgi:hypothetical protein